MKNTLPQKALYFCVLFLTLNSPLSIAFAQFWNLTGNAGANPTNGNFIGTTDNLPLEARVSGQRALRLEPNTNGAPNVIAGSRVNFIAPGVVGAVIAGGGAALYPVINTSIPYTNSVSSDFGAIGGGYLNRIHAGSIGSTISGGFNNWIQMNASYSSIGGGNQNLIQTTAGSSTIGGGYVNYIQPGATYSTIAGGVENLVQSNASSSVIGGGYNNIASGSYATIPGGYDNTAGSYSFAAGHQASAIHSGTFVWADSAGPGVFSTTGPNQFLIRAAGGVGIGLTNPVATLHVSSSTSLPELQITQTNPNDYTRLRMNVANHASWEMDVTPNAAPSLQFWNSSLRMWIDFNGNVSATSFNPSSDRNLKENISPISPREVLDKVAALPITRWNFKEDAATKHLGPMAQDFYAAFGVGLDDKHIATVDEGGVALAAIQGLNEKLQDELKRRDTENAELKHQLDQLKATVDALQQASSARRL